MQKTVIKFTDLKFPQQNPVLQSVSSEIQKSRLVGIIGPSGCGKTTLLKILSGRFTQRYSGDVFYGDQKVTKRDRLLNSVYVHQDDILLSFLTVKETILFYESLINSKHEDLIGLENVLDQRIGTSKSGISAGERKRLSILIGLLEHKEILFFDEPTSGLDALNALKLMDILKRLEGTRICVIHQPSSEIFFKFDDVIIMHSGKIVYEGESKSIFKWFENLGVDCPRYTNPADFIFTNVFPRLIKTYGPKLNGYKTFKVNSQIVSDNECVESILNIEKIPYSQKTNSFFEEFKILWRRNLKIAIRNKSRFFGRCIQSTFSALVIGLIYWKTFVQPEPNCSRNVFGLLYFISTSAFFTSAMSSLPDLYSTEILLEREYQNKYYKYLSYFCAKISFDMLLCSINPLIFIPLVSLFTHYKIWSVNFLILFLTALNTTIIGYSTAILVASFCPNLILASAILPSVLLPLTLLNGMLVQSSSLISYLKILEYFSPTRYSFNILVRNYFDFNQKQHEQFTKNFINFKIDVWGSMSLIFLMIVVNFIISCYFLIVKINKKI